MKQRCKTNKLIRHCDQEINQKVMLYSNIGSKASQPKVCVHVLPVLTSWRVLFVPNVFKILKLWQIFVCVSCIRALTPINHTFI
jgi:hypothetical protein